MFDFIGKKSDQKGKKKNPGTDFSSDGPNSLLDVVIPFPNAEEKASDLPPDSLLSQIDALSRKHEDNVAEKLAMEQAELRAKRMAFERKEQETRLKAEQEASLRFKQKADFLDQEIERVKLAKFHEMQATELAKAQVAATKAPEPANLQQAQEPPQMQAAVSDQRDHYSQYPPQGSATMPPHYGAPMGQVPTEPVAVSAPHPIVPPRPAYVSWPARNNVPEGMASPPAHDGFVATPYQPASPEEYHAATRPAGWGEGEPSHPHPGTWPADDYRGAQQQYQAPAQEAPPSYPAQAPPQSPPHQEASPYRANSAGPVAQPSTADYSSPPEPGLYDSYYEGPPQDPNSAQHQPVPNHTSLDIEGIIRSVFASWKSIAVMAIIGAVLAGAFSMTLANKYQAWAELIIDPSDVKILDNQISPTGYSGDAMIAYLRSQQRIMESTSVLNVVIESQKLLLDEEFNAKNSDASNWWEVIIPPPRRVRDANKHQLVLEKLEEALVIARSSGTFVYSIGVTTENAQKSAEIANAVAQAYVSVEASARSKVALDTSYNLSGKLATLENNVRTAEQKIADYKAEHKIFSSEGKLTSEVQLSRLNEQLANAKVATINAKTRMEQAQTTNLADVISGSLPASLTTNTISQLRVRYASLKSNADKLATKLGRRHPERIAAQAELASARRATSGEIRRIIAGTSKEYQRAKKRQKSLGQQVLALKAASVDVGSSLIALHQLERDLTAHQRVYENYLLRSRETGEQEGIASANVRIISKATPPLEKVGPKRKIITGLGLFAGLALGILLAVLRGVSGAMRGSSSPAPEVREPEQGQFVPQHGFDNRQNAAAPDHRSAQPGYGQPPPQGYYPAR